MNHDREKGLCYINVGNEFGCRALDGGNDDYDDCLLQVTVAFLHLVRRSSKNSHVNILLA